MERTKPKHKYEVGQRVYHRIDKVHFTIKVRDWTAANKPTYSGVTDDNKPVSRALEEWCSL